MFLISSLFALVDTKDKSLTNCEIALTTDPESEQESLYASLFKVMGSDENESELINRVKEKSSVVISDDCSAFHNSAKAPGERSAIGILRVAHYEKRKEEEKWMG